MASFQEACISVAKKTLRVGDIRKNSDNGDLYKVLKIFTNEIRIRYLNSSVSSIWDSAYPALDKLIERE